MKNIFKSKRNILIMMFALVVIMGIGFAAYSQQLRINDTSSIDSNWDIYIKDVSVPSKTSGAIGSGTVDEVEKLKAELTTDLKYPGDYVIYNITVANDGTIDAILEKINFSMEKEDTVINYYYSVDDQTTWNKVTKNGENPYNEDLLANTTDEFQVKVEYDPTKTGTATKEQKSNKLTLNLDYAQKSGGSVPSGPLAAEILKENITTSGDGLYADNTEEGRYVYKGANPNNYITFNDESWRILAVESDGTLKIMRSNSIGDIPYDSKGYRDSGSNGAGGTYCAKDDSGCNAWAISDNFILNKTFEYEGTVLKDAELNTYLNDKNNSNSYYNKLNNSSKDLIHEHSWNIGPVEYSDADMPSMISQEKKYTWTGNIALMNASDYYKANSNISQCGDDNVAREHYSDQLCKATNYMTTMIGTATNQKVFSLTPSTSSVHTPWIINRDYGASGDWYGFVSYTDIGVLPTLYLKSNITLSGNGTSDNPYAIN